MSSLLYIATHFTDASQHRTLNAIIPPMPLWISVAILMYLKKIRGHLTTMRTWIGVLFLIYLAFWLLTTYSLHITHQESQQSYYNILYPVFALIPLFILRAAFPARYWYKTDEDYLKAHPIPNGTDVFANHPHPMRAMFLAYWIKTQKWLAIAGVAISVFVMISGHLNTVPLWQSGGIIYIALGMVFIYGMFLGYWFRCPNCQRPPLELLQFYKPGKGSETLSSILKTHQFQCPTCSARYTVNAAPSNHNPKP